MPVFFLAALAILISTGALGRMLSAAPAPPPEQSEQPTAASEPPPPPVITLKPALPLLVNAQNPLPEDYPAVKTVDMYRKVDVLNVSIKVSEEIAAPLIEMFDAAKAAGHSGMFLSDGYRTETEQQALYDAAENKAFVQPPGCSEHQTGLSVDISISKVPAAQMADNPTGKWFIENCWQYGFILRYPADKADITGISYEPWHFRYVGLDAAKVCHDQNLCLEEYIEMFGG
ncbi:MAG: D-alanyl-D-alanine carboxypeptidase family protein [Oscillospiraceae bacterium]|nr:D-alanyl-D-alanine carboxypeptidase family protein [Oscillospiraceae bacterium]